MTGELVCCSTREVGTAKQRSQKRFCLVDTARDKHNSGFRALASRVIHRFALHRTASADTHQGEDMHPLKKMALTRALALALLSVAMLHYQAESADAQPGSESWQPALAAPMRLINPFYQPNSDYSAGHRGVDYAVQSGQPVFAPTAGEIWFAGEVVNRGVLTIRTQTGDLVSFEPVCSDLKKGDQVRPGQSIAQVCPGQPSYVGHCGALMCLHYSLRNQSGYLSPLVRWGALSPSVLLATANF